MGLNNLNLTHTNKKAASQRLSYLYALILFISPAIE